ncbi:MAG: hypothetical protein WCD70_03560 [Alphaproteobacteria bacterium]
MKTQPVERLEKKLDRVAKEEEVAQERLRRWVSFLALSGVLECAVRSKQNKTVVNTKGREVERDLWQLMGRTQLPVYRSWHR